MMPRLRGSLAFATMVATLAGLAPALGWAGPAPDEPREGLVVIAAPAAGSLAEAGLQPGDVLLSWQRGPFSGVLRWPSGLAEVETEQARGQHRPPRHRGSRLQGLLLPQQGLPPDQRAERTRS